MPEQKTSDRKWYVICCRVCDGDGEPLPIPFETAEARGKWAAEHKKKTGHDSWIVLDEERDA